MGERIGISSALVRKDLAWFGEFGKQGVGYEVEYLRKELLSILNLNREIKVALIGAGSLDSALVRYNQNRNRTDSTFSMKIAAVFDNDENKTGTVLAGLEILPFSSFAEYKTKLGLDLAVITVPAIKAQEVADRLVQSGIRQIFNLAPVKLAVPPEVKVTTADLSLELECLAYYLKP
jgi:redox-sensing transcriptional repressor